MKTKQVQYTVLTRTWLLHAHRKQEEKKDKWRRIHVVNQTECVYCQRTSAASEPHTSNSNEASSLIDFVSLFTEPVAQPRPDRTAVSYRSLHDIDRLHDVKSPKLKCTARVADNSALVRFTECTRVGKRLHTLPSHKALSEPQSFSWGTVQFSPFSPLPWLIWRGGEGGA